MNRSIHFFDEPPPPTPQVTLGGKAAGLVRLQTLGVSVPPWMCLSTQWTERILSRIPRALWDEVGGDSTLPVGEIRAALENNLDAKWGREVRHHFEVLFGADARVAVRSSAVAEDSSTQSFAGQFETYLGVARVDLLARVLDCIATGFSPAIGVYRGRQGVNADRGIAVVIQAMIDSEKSGVLFTANPATGNRSEMVVTAAYGLGEGVVADRVEADTYRVHHGTYERVDAVVRTKRSQIVSDRSAKEQTRVAPVPEDRWDRSVLDDAELETLCREAQRLYERVGAHLDIEWAIDAGGQLCFLQMRPITTLSEGQHRVFDNANIVEGYPGVTTPLTFSFARASYAIVFAEMALAFGVSRARLQKSQWALDSLLAYLRGRIYYHLPSWYRFYSLVPGFDRNMEAFEKAMSIDNPEIWQDAQAEAQRSSRFPLAERIAVYSRTARNWLLLDRTIKAFHQRFEARRGPLAKRIRDATGPDELADIYDEIVGDLIHAWAPAVVNDVYAFNAYNLLSKALARCCPGEGDALLSGLLSGIAGMQSVEPLHSILRLVERAHAQSEIVALFDSQTDDDSVWAALTEFPDFKEACAEHIREYGDRIHGELKLEQPGLDETPERIVSLCRMYLHLGKTVESQQRREVQIRRAAERTLVRHLRYHPLRRALIRALLNLTRRTIRNRENTRLERTRLVGLVKRLFRRLGGQLEAMGLTGAREDIFYLTPDEIIGAVRGTGATTEIRALAKMRRAEHDVFEKEEAPSRIETYGPVLRDPALLGFPRAEPPTSAEGSATEGSPRLIRGIGCAPGRVRARARVVLSPEKETGVNGEILVARSTDPGWIFLMVAARGLVVERGNLLSHTAIIGRELGIPTVIGAEDATRRIANGAWIEVDGNRGIVSIESAKSK